jgi:hypothetical protein
LGRFLLEVHGQCFSISAYKLFDVFDLRMSKTVRCSFAVRPGARQQDRRGIADVEGIPYAVAFAVLSVE